MTSTFAKLANPNGLHPAAPIPALGQRYQMLVSSGSSGVGSGSLGANTLPAFSGTFLQSETIDCVAWDAALLEIQYNGNASSTTGFPWIIPLGSTVPQQSTSTQASPPLLTDDVWTQFPVTDGAVTPTFITGSLGYGSGSSAGSAHGVQKVYGLVIQPESVVSGSTKIRMSVNLKTRAYRFLSFAVAEKGDTTNPGKLDIWITGII